MQGPRGPLAREESIAASTRRRGSSSMEKGLPREMLTIQAKHRHSPDVSCRLDRRKALCAFLATAFILLAAMARPAAADPLAVKVGVIRQTHSRETIS